MKKYVPYYAIIGFCLGFSFCLAQDMETNRTPGFNTMMVDDSSTSRPSLKQLEKGAANYLQALQQPNEGLVESAMINLIKMKSYYPDLDYSRLTNRLQYLAEQGRTQSLRFLAFFTRHYLEEPVNIGWLQQGEHEFSAPKEFFLKIVQK
jgi:hypothetical protein